MPQTVYKLEEINYAACANYNSGNRQAFTVITVGLSVYLIQPDDAEYQTNDSATHACYSCDKSNKGQHIDTGSLGWAGRRVVTRICIWSSRWLNRVIWWNAHNVPFISH